MTIQDYIKKQKKTLNVELTTSRVFLFGLYNCS